jgi:cbb3-type cytochrome oxidase cytochrome c subunit
VLRPAASSSKTHDKPNEKPSSPPRKAPAASKPSTLQKGKKKVEEVVSKAKAVVTNGDSEEHKNEEETAKESEHADQATEETATNETSHESEKPATPVQDTDSSVAELQTLNLQEETVR